MLSGNINVPKTGSMKIESRGLLTEILLDGESMGRRAWAPFVWDIPGKFKGHSAKLTIIMTTSVGPLFGDYVRRVCKDPGSWLFSYAPGLYNGSGDNATEA